MPLAQHPNAHLRTAILLTSLLLATSALVAETINTTDPPPAAPESAPAPPTAQDAPPTCILSPDGKSSVRILEQPVPGTDDPLDNFTLEIRFREEVVARAPTTGYLASAHWTPDGRLVAINNRRGNAGDYLWVYALPEGTCLKRADDPLGTRWIGAALAEIEDAAPGATADSLIRNWLTADECPAPDQLRITIRARYRGPGAFDFTAPVVLRNGKLVIQAGAVKHVE